MVVPKLNGKEIRICGDYTVLNRSVKRAVHPIPKVDVALAKLKGSKIFSKLDAKTGYHQLKLDKESQKLTTFITPFGRYMHTRLPYGVNCASDYFSKEFTEVLGNIPNVLMVVDDILIYGQNVEEHDKTLRTVLGRLKSAGITLNKDKCIIGVQEIDFLGHRISEQGISILPERVDAIANFPVPKNKETLLQFLGIVNYIGKFIPNKSSLLEPLNSLLKDGVSFDWFDKQEKAFRESMCSKSSDISSL